MSVLSEVINMAILKEKEAVELYSELYQAAENKEVRELARKLQEIEGGHIKKLTNLLHSNDFDDLGMPDNKYQEIKETVEGEQLKNVPGVQDLLGKALEEEKKAVLFYHNIAEVFKSYQAARKLFLKLAEEEKGHQSHLEQVLA